jgi:hypothetical protein
LQYPSPATTSRQDGPIQCNSLLRFCFGIDELSLTSTGTGTVAQGRNAQAVTSSIPDNTIARFSSYCNSPNRFFSCVCSF